MEIEKEIIQIIEGYHEDMYDSVQVELYKHRVNELRQKIKYFGEKHQDQISPDFNFKLAQLYAQLDTLKETLIYVKEEDVDLTINHPERMKLKIQQYLEHLDPKIKKILRYNIESIAIGDEHTRRQLVRELSGIQEDMTDFYSINSAQFSTSEEHMFDNQLRLIDSLIVTLNNPLPRKK